MSDGKHFVEEILPNWPQGGGMNLGGEKVAANRGTVYFCCRHSCNCCRSSSAPVGWTCSIIPSAISVHSIASSLRPILSDAKPRFKQTSPSPLRYPTSRNSATDSFN